MTKQKNSEGRQKRRGKMEKSVGGKKERGEKRGGGRV